MTFPVKLVKTAECHQFVSKRPVIVPICKTGPESHLLIFLGFANRPAFSHKELMVPFDRVHGKVCQNDEVSLDVHTAMSRAKGSSDTPTVNTVARSSSDSAHGRI